MFNEVAPIGQLIVAALSGGGISFVIGKLIDRRHASEQSEIQRLREDFDKCEKRHEECQRDLTELSERVRAVEASTPSYLARWVKGQDKKLIWLNDRAYLMLFAPLGWHRSDVLDKTFDDLLGEGAGEAIKMIEELDVLALQHPGETHSMVLQLHPSLPTMAVIKVAFVAADGLLRYEGCAYVPNGLSESIGVIREARARQAASRRLFQEGEGDGP